MSYGLLLTKVFEYNKLNFNQLPNFQVTATNSNKAPRNIIPLAGFGSPPMIEFDPTHHATPIAPTAPLATPSQHNFEKEMAKLQLPMMSLRP